MAVFFEAKLRVTLERVDELELFLSVEEADCAVAVPNKERLVVVTEGEASRTAACQAFDSGDLRVQHHVPYLDQHVFCRRY